MSKTIAYFIPSAHLAGTTTQAFAFCSSMLALGYDVQLVVATKRGEFLDVTEDPPYRTVYLHKAKYCAAIFTVFYLTCYLIKEKPVIFIAGAKRSNMLAIIAHSLSLRMSRLILILTNDLRQCKGSAKRPRNVSTALHLFMYRSAHHIVVLTTAMREVFLKANYSSKGVTVIPPPLNLPQINLKSFEASNHPWLKEPKAQRDTAIILAVGRIAPQKNYRNLIKALAVVNKTQDVKLIILGTGKAKFTQSIKDLVRKSALDDIVDFAQFSANPYSFMREVDALALSSHWEGFGIVLTEALACGLTTASVDCPHGPREILGGGTFGYLAAPNDPGALARAILSSINSPINPNILKLKAAEYSAKVIASKYQSLIDEMWQAEIKSQIKGELESV